MEEICPCCRPGERKTRRDEAEKKKLINRLARIEGQIRGMRGMLERDAYCADVLTQSAAAGAALDAFNRELLTSHLNSCVVSDIRSGREGAVDELSALLKKLMR